MPQLRPTVPRRPCHVAGPRTGGSCRPRGAKSIRHDPLQIVAPALRHIPCHIPAFLARWMLTACEGKKEGSCGPGWTYVTSCPDCELLIGGLISVRSVVQVHPGPQRLTGFRGSIPAESFPPSRNWLCGGLRRPSLSRSWSARWQQALKNRRVHPRQAAPDGLMRRLLSLGYMIGQADLRCAGVEGPSRPIFASRSPFGASGRPCRRHPARHRADLLACSELPSPSSELGGRTRLGALRYRLRLAW